MHEGSDLTVPSSLAFLPEDLSWMITREDEGSIYIYRQCKIKDKIKYWNNKKKIGRKGKKNN